MEIDATGLHVMNMGMEYGLQANANWRIPTV